MAALPADRLLLALFSSLSTAGAQTPATVLRAVLSLHWGSRLPERTERSMRGGLGVLPALRLGRHRGRRQGCGHDGRGWRGCWRAGCRQQSWRDRSCQDACCRQCGRRDAADPDHG
jgi:hypothetical protein